MPRTSLDAAIQRTTAYSHTFRTSLSWEQLTRYLIADVPVSKAQLQQRGKYDFPEVKPLSHSDQKLWQQALRAAAAIQRLPWVQSVWLTGGLAARSDHHDQDIDLMIVTDPQRLWLTRLLVTTVARLAGVYRHRLATPASAEVIGRWCLNLWLEPAAFRRFSQEQNLYIARELIQAELLTSRAGTRPALLLAHNRWVKDYCYNGWKDAMLRAQTRTTPTNDVGVRHGWSPLLDTLNDWCRRWQWRYMAPVHTVEPVFSDAALFHPRPTRHHVLERYEKICTQYGIDPYPAAVARMES